MTMMTAVAMASAVTILICDDIANDITNIRAELMAFRIHESECLEYQINALRKVIDPQNLISSLYH